MLQFYFVDTNGDKHLDQMELEALFFREVGVGVATLDWPLSEIATLATRTAATHAMSCSLISRPSHPGVCRLQY